MRAFAFAVFALFVACSSYASVHSEASDMLAEVGACNAGDACVIVPGVSGDCTGLLACDFPARADRANEAHARAVDIANRSRGFSECALAFCASLSHVSCDPVAHRCTDSASAGDAGRD